MNIALAFDDKYLPYAYVTLFSSHQRLYLSPCACLRWRPLYISVINCNLDIDYDSPFSVGGIAQYQQYPGHAVTYL